MKSLLETIKNFNILIKLVLIFTTLFYIMLSLVILTVPFYRILFFIPLTIPYFEVMLLDVVTYNNYRLKPLILAITILFILYFPVDFLIF